LNSKNNWAKYREPAPLIYSLTPDFLKLFCYPMKSNMDCITENHQPERPFLPVFENKKFSSSVNGSKQLFQLWQFNRNSVPVFDFTMIGATFIQKQTTN
jgi:hypothetical protein